MDDPLQWFERQLAGLERRQDELRADFHAHTEQAVHPGFVDVLKDIREDLKVLQARWLQVGGVVISILLTILLSLIGVLWALFHPTLPREQVVAPTRTVCSNFVSQAEAQAYYRGNPIAGAVLDGDRDGKACEDNSPPYDWVIVTP